jgi:beta-lactamase class A
VLVLLLSAGVSTNQAEPKQPAPSEPTLWDLQAEIEGIAKTVNGVLGVTAYHIESTQRVSIRGTEAFPMASVYKIPIALKFLRRVDLGLASLDRSVTVTSTDLRTGHSVLPGLMQNGTVTLPARELLRLMLVASDNTSSDTVLELAGGPPAVTKRMQDLGVTGIRVDRSVVEMMLDEAGVTNALPPELWTFQVVRELLDRVTPAERRAGLTKFLSDPRDTATPDAMVHLLFIIQRRIGLLRPQADLLVDFMEQSKTGQGRLKGLLPKGTPVAHKTGTLDCCNNDAGIITLPNGKGHVAIAAFIKGSSSPRAASAQSAAIAQIGRAAYEYWSGEKVPTPTKVKAKPPRHRRQAVKRSPRTRPHGRARILTLH